MKITKQKLGKIIQEELKNILSEVEAEGSSELASITETLWDIVRSLYKLGHSGTALKLQRIAEELDQGHERLVPRGEQHSDDVASDLGLKLGSPSSQDIWDLKNKLNLG